MNAVQLTKMKVFFNLFDSCCYMYLPSKLMFKMFKSPCQELADLKKGGFMCCNVMD